MATDTLNAATIAAPPDLPSPSWTDRLLSFPDRLPGPAIGWYVASALALLAVAHLAVWATGGTPIGHQEPEIIPPAPFLAYFLWFIHALNRVARFTFDDFRPALGGGTAAQVRYRFELTSIPDRLAVPAIVIAEVIILTAYYFAVRPLRPAVPPAVEVVSGPLWAMLAAVSGVLFLHTVRQLRLISRLSAMATNVDIFKPAPINSFSRLTAVSAIGIVVFVSLFALGSSDQPPGVIASEGVMIGLAVASFVLPMRVMHGRLVAEKARLQAEAQDRLKAVLALLHRAVDENDLSRADQLQKTLDSVLAERDVLAKLPTWPWTTATFRGLVTAVLLPVTIFVITRVIDRLL